MKTDQLVTVQMPDFFLGPLIRFPLYLNATQKKVLPTKDETKACEEAVWTDPLHLDSFPVVLYFTLI